MGIAVQNETDAVKSSLTDDNLDSLDLIEQLMIAEEEPPSFSDIVPPNNELVASPATGEADDAVSSEIVSDSNVANDATELGLNESIQSPLDSIALPPVDVTAFQSMPFDDVVSNGVLFALIFALIVAGLYVTGAGMKMACFITGGGSITIRRGIVASILMSAAYAITALVCNSLSGGSSPLYSLGFQVVVGTLVLALLLWQNPIRALATGVIASILQTTFLIGILTATIIMVGKFVPPKKLQQLAEHTQSFTDSVAKEVLPGEEEKTRQLLSVKSLIESQKDHASASEPTPKKKPIYEPGLRSNPFVD